MASNLFAFISCALFSVCLGLCQNGWTRFYDSCYMIGYEQNLTFIEAEHYCRQHNGHLVFVNTADENRFLVDTIQKTKAGSCWIGISDMDVEGIWQWYGTGNKPEFTYWSPGEPNGHQKEDCAAYSQTHAFKWVDFSCDHYFHPVCESSTDTVDTSIIG